MNIVAIVQARMGSTRLPGKVLADIANKPAIELLLKRLDKSTKVSSICVATSVAEENDPLCERVARLGYSYFRGSETDVLERFYQAAKQEKSDVIVRITGDCPLVDPVVVDGVIDIFEKNKVDYASNIDPPSYPDGLDVEVFSMHALERAVNEATKSFDREHVTPYLRSKQFSSVNLLAEENLSNFRLTLDQVEDLHVLRKIFENFSDDIFFGFFDAVNYLRENEEIIKINDKIKRNEGG